MKRKSTIFALLLCCLLLLLLLFPLWAGRSSLAALSLPAVAAEDIRLLEVSARWEEEEYSIEDRAFFAELLSLFQGIELRPLLLPPSSYPIEKGSAYWFRVQLEDERQSVFKIMGGKLLLNVVCGESPGRQHYAITDGEEKLPEIFALLEEYHREAKSSSPLLQEKLTVGLRSADVVERYAWERVQQQLSYLEKIKPELNLLDAGIQLEKTDSFTEFYPDREIEAWHFSSRIQSDPVPQPDTGLPALDEAGWLSNDIGLGPCWLIVENIGGERSVLGHCYPEGEDIGLPSCITASLIHRDLEAGLDVSALLLRDLAYSIRHDPIPNAPGFLFRVPEKCPNAESDLRIRVFGSKDGTETELSGEIFSVSDSLPRWKAGNYYRFPCVVEEYDGLHMELSLPGVDGQRKAVELRIDLLSLAAEITPSSPDRLNISQA